MVGWAMAVWNSSKGVPLGVWHLIATAEVVCKGSCDLVRSLDGDCAHRTTSGLPLFQVKYVDISEEEEDDEMENTRID